MFLALYSPNLPKWQNFSSTLSLLGERFAGNDSKLLVVKGNCREHPVSVGAAWVLCVFEAPLSRLPLWGRVIPMVSAGISRCFFDTL